MILKWGNKKLSLNPVFVIGAAISDNYVTIQLDIMSKDKDEIKIKCDTIEHADELFNEVNKMIDDFNNGVELEEGREVSDQEIEGAFEDMYRTRAWLNRTNAGKITPITPELLAQIHNDCAIPAYKLGVGLVKPVIQLGLGKHTELNKIDVFCRGNFIELASVRKILKAALPGWIVNDIGIEVHS